MSRWWFRDITEKIFFLITHLWNSYAYILLVYFISHSNYDIIGWHLFDVFMVFLGLLAWAEVATSPSPLVPFEEKEKKEQKKTFQHC